MKYPREWEKVADHVLGSTFRMKVPNGWLISDNAGDNSVSLTFLPDPKHEWELEDE